MNIPDNYKVLFLQGGASQQFSADPNEPDEEQIADTSSQDSGQRKHTRKLKIYGKAKSCFIRR